MANVANSADELDGATLITADDNQDVEGLKTFARAPGAPFAVEAGSALVTNLDAHLLNGHPGDFYQSASNMISGTIPPERIPDPLPVVSGQNLYNLNADNLVSGYVPSARKGKVIATSDSGTITAWSPSGYLPYVDTVIYWTGATADLRVMSFSPGVADGQVLTIKNRSGPGRVINLPHYGPAGSGTLFYNVAGSADTPIGPEGWAQYQFVAAAGVWIMVDYEQGGWITPPFNAAAFTAQVGTWSVTAPNCALTYKLDGRSLNVKFLIGPVPVSGGGTYLYISNLMWGGFTCSRQTAEPTAYLNNGAPEPGVLQNSPNTQIAIFKLSQANYIAFNTVVYGGITMEAD